MPSNDKRGQSSSSPKSVTAKPIPSGSVPAKPPATKSISVKPVASVVKPAANSHSAVSSPTAPKTSSPARPVLIKEDPVLDPAKAVALKKPAAAPVAVATATAPKTGTKQPTTKQHSPKQSLSKPAPKQPPSNPSASGESIPKQSTHKDSIATKSIPNPSKLEKASSEKSVPKETVAKIPVSQKNDIKPKYSGSIPSATNVAPALKKGPHPPPKYPVVDYKGGKPKPKASPKKSIFSRFLKLVIHLFMYYVIYLAVWRCPPSSKLDPSSPSLCPKIHNAFFSAKQYVEPYHAQALNHYNQRVSPYVAPYLEQAKPYTDKAALAVNQASNKVIDASKNAQSAVLPVVVPYYVKSSELYNSRVSPVVVKYQGQLGSLWSMHVQPHVETAKLVLLDAWQKVSPHYTAAVTKYTPYWFVAQKHGSNYVSQGYQYTKSKIIDPSYNYAVEGTANSYAYTCDNIYPLASKHVTNYWNCFSKYSKYYWLIATETWIPMAKAWYYEHVDPQISKIIKRVQNVSSGSTTTDKVADSKSFQSSSTVKVHSKSAAETDSDLASSETIAETVKPVSSAETSSKSTNIVIDSKEIPIQEKQSKAPKPPAVDFIKWKQVVDRTSSQAIDGFISNVDSQKSTLAFKGKHESDRLIQSLQNQQRETHSELGKLVDDLEAEVKKYTNYEETNTLPENYIFPYSSLGVESSFKDHADKVRSESAAVRKYSDEFTDSVTGSIDKLRADSLYTLAEFSKVTLKEVSYNLAVEKDPEASARLADKSFEEIESEFAPSFASMLWGNWKEYRKLKNSLYSSRDKISGYRVPMREVDEVVKNSQGATTAVSKEVAQFMSDLKTRVDKAFAKKSNVDRKLEEKSKLVEDEAKLSNKHEETIGFNAQQQQKQHVFDTSNKKPVEKVVVSETVRLASSASPVVADDSSSVESSGFGAASAANYAAEAVVAASLASLAGKAVFSSSGNSESVVATEPTSFLPVQQAPSLKSKVKGDASLLSETVKSAVSSDPVSSVVDNATYKNVESLGSSVESVVSKPSKSAESVVDKVIGKKPVSSVQSAAESVIFGNAAASLIKRAANTPSTGASVGSSVSSVVSESSKSVQSIVDSAKPISSVSSAATEAASSVSSVVSESSKSAQSIVDSVKPVSSIKSAATEIASSASSVLSKPSKSVQSVVESVADGKSVSSASSIVSESSKSVQSVVESVINTKSTGAGITSSAKDAAEAVVGGAIIGEGIAKVASVASSAGKPSTDSGIASSISSVVSKSSKSAQSIIDSAKPLSSMSSAATEAASSVGSAVTESSKSVQSIVDSAKPVSSVSSAATEAASSVSSVVSESSKSAQSIVDSVKPVSSIKSAATEIASSASSVLSKPSKSAQSVVASVVDEKSVSSASSIVSESSKSVQSVVESVINTKSTGAGIASSAKDAAEVIVGGAIVGEGVSKAASLANKVVGTSAVTSGVASSVGSIVTESSKSAQSIADSAKPVSSIKSAATEVVSSASSVLSKPSKSVQSVVESVVDEKSLSSASSIVSEPSKSVQSVVESVIDTKSTGAGIASSAKDAAEAIVGGAIVGEGVAKVVSVASSVGKPSTTSGVASSISSVVSESLQSGKYIIDSAVPLSSLESTGIKLASSGSSVASASSNTVKSIVDSADPTKSVQSAETGIASSVSSAISQPSQSVKSAVDSIADTDSVSSTVSAAGSAADSIVNSVVDTVSVSSTTSTGRGFFAGMKSAAYAAVGVDVAASAASVIDKAVHSSSTIVDSESTDSIKTVISASGKSGINDIIDTDSVSSVGASQTSVADSSVSHISSSIKSIVSESSQSVNSVVDSVADADPIASAKSTVSSIASDVDSSVSSIIDTASVSSTTSTGRGFFAGMKSAAYAAVGVDVAASAASAVDKAVHSSSAIVDSESTDSIKTVISDSTDSVKSAAFDLTDSATLEHTGTVVSGFTNTAVSKITGSAKSAVTDSTDSVKSVVSSSTDSAKSVVSKKTNAYHSISNGYEDADYIYFIRTSKTGFFASFKTIAQDILGHEAVSSAESMFGYDKPVTTKIAKSLLDSNHYFAYTEIPNTGFRASLKSMAVDILGNEAVSSAESMLGYGKPKYTKPAKPFSIKTVSSTATSSVESSSAAATASTLPVAESQSVKETGTVSKNGGFFGRIF